MTNRVLLGSIIVLKNKIQCGLVHGMRVQKPLWNEQIYEWTNKQMTLPKTISPSIPSGREADNNAKCPHDLYSQHETLNHTLNYCSFMRYGWRHDFILNHVCSLQRDHIPGLYHSYLFRYKLKITHPNICRLNIHFGHLCKHCIVGRKCQQI